MRIIVLLSSLGTGGAEYSTLTFYGWLLKQGHNVKLICYKKANPSYDPLPFGFDQIQYIAGNTFLKRIKSLNAIINEFKPQLVHSVLFEANLLTRIDHLMNRKFIHLESLVNETYSAFRLLDPNITKLKLEGYRLLDRITQRKGVDHFHANGIAVAKHYQEKLGIDPRRITIVPRGRQANPFVGDVLNREKLRGELQTGDRLLIINVARHEFQKGQDVLLDALDKLGPLKEKIQIVLAGREGNLTPLIRHKISAYKLESCVLILGHRNDVNALLAAADIFVFPSRFEGLPGVLMEAEAAGLPIICSDIPNNREVAEENRNALFFAVNDVQQLSETIFKLARDKELQKKMGTESLAVYEQKFSLEEVHQTMLSLLEKLTQSA